MQPLVEIHPTPHSATSSTGCNPACRRPIRFIVLLVFVSFSFFANPIGREHAQTLTPPPLPLFQQNCKCKAAPAALLFSSSLCSSFPPSSFCSSVSLCSSLCWSVAFYTEQTRLWRRSGTTETDREKERARKRARVGGGMREGGGGENKCNAMKIVKNRKTKVFVLFICCCLFGSYVGRVSKWRPLVSVWVDATVVRPPAWLWLAASASGGV